MGIVIAAAWADAVAQVRSLPWELGLREQPKRKKKLKGVERD